MLYVSHNTAVYLDVEDVVYTVGDLFCVESADQIFAFTNANEFQDLVDHIKGVIQVSHTDNYGVMISQSMTVGVLVKSNGLCPIIDSHQHLNSNGGGKIIMANPRKLSLNMPVACSKIRISLWIWGPYVIWETLGEIYNVIIPTAKKIQVIMQS